MKKYKYTAINIEKKKFSGIFFAKNEEHLRQMLSDQQLFLISFKVISDKSPNAFFTLTGKISLKELSSFCRQLAIMISSSIELINCLDILRHQPFSSYFKKILDIVYDDVKAGKLLSEAMRKHKKVFPEFFINMVYVGEMSSSLNKILVNVADYYETEQSTKSRIQGALAYPIVLLIMMLGVLAIMMLFVVPTFKTSLAQMEVEMPALTLAIFDISNFIIINWKTLLIAIIGVILLIKLFSKTKSGRMFFDTLKMKTPLIKKYQVAKVTSRFARGFGLLLSSGMNMVESMEVMENVLGNKYVEKKFKIAIEDVRKGITLTKALDRMNVFPIMLIQMIAVGERTASVDEVLLSSCKFFDEKVTNTLNAITSLIQPILMVIMGVLIGIIFIAVYSPMISVMEQLG